MDGSMSGSGGGGGDMGESVGKEDASCDELLLFRHGGEGVCGWAGDEEGGVSGGGDGVEGPFRRRLWEMMEASQAVEEDCMSAAAGEWKLKTNRVGRNGNIKPSSSGIESGRGGEKSRKRGFMSESGSTHASGRTRSSLPQPFTVWRVELTATTINKIRSNGKTNFTQSVDDDVMCDMGSPRLRVVEERVIRKSGSISGNDVHCEHCNCVGWSSHPVSSRRYHFIIPQSEKAWTTLVRDKTVNLDDGIGGVHGAAYTSIVRNGSGNGDGSGSFIDRILSCRAHLLHGVLHGNGYGHLLRLNGREGGSNNRNWGFGASAGTCAGTGRSKSGSGRRNRSGGRAKRNGDGSGSGWSGKMIMNFWDRLCKALHARQVTVQDVSVKVS